MKGEKLAKTLSRMAVLALVLTPFTAFFSTWAGSNFGYLDWFRIWKELLLVPLTLGALWLIYRDKTRFLKLFKNRLTYLILLYVLLHISLGLYAYLDHRVNFSALIYALLINTRFLIFFIDCVIIASYSDILKKKWQKLLFVPAGIVIGFGLLQLVLPKDFLAHFGYGDKTIPAYHTIDQKEQYQRIQSFMRGPNPLGAYLTVVLTAVAVVVATYKRKLKNGYILLGAAGVLALVFTFSRSAWLGLFMSLAVLAFIGLAKWRKQAALILVSGLIVFGAGAFALKDNNTFQNAVFHTDENSRSSESSNTARLEAVGSNFKVLVDEPLGSGPGTAGPASFRNSFGPKIAENYYIQIGQEVGLIGLGIFLTINAMVAVQLWRNRKDNLALVLICSFAGITIINLLLHAWADEVLSLIWWGFAGVALAPVLITAPPLPAKTKH